MIQITDEYYADTDKYNWILYQLEKIYIFLANDLEMAKQLGL